MVLLTARDFCQADFPLELRVADRIRLALPQPTEWQRIADWIDAASVRIEFVARRAHARRAADERSAKPEPLSSLDR
jgi:hypothetical protein